MIIIITVLLMFAKHTSAVVGVRNPMLIRKNIALKYSPTTLNELTSKNPGYSIKVVSDVDDTIKSSGGVKLFGIPLGGIDTHFKRGEIYPGVLQFYLELSKGLTSYKNKSPPKVAILTARAREFLFALALKPADKLCTAFRKLGNENGFEDWGVGVETDVYYGSVIEWILQDRKGIRKYMNFEKMLQNDARLGRKENYVLVGDTGEKDEEAGERIAKMYPKRIKAVFLHAVTDKDRSKFSLPPDRIVNGVPFLYFQTYVGAAMKARNIGLMSNVAVQRIIAQSKLDLTAKEPRSGYISGSPSTRWLELERDIQLVKKTEARAVFKNILPFFSRKS
jgi:hypothetical protein